MKTMAFRLLPDLHLAINGASDPTDLEWTTYIDAVVAKMARGYDVSRMRTLVFSDGGGPNAAQRKLVHATLAGRSTRVAMVSSSLAVRGVTTALAWFNPLIKSFHPEEVTSAFRFLDIREEEYGAVWTEIQRLERELDISGLKSVVRGRAVAPGPRSPGAAST